MNNRPSMRQFLLKAIRSRSPASGRLRLSMAGTRCARDLYYAATGAATEEVSDERMMKMAIGAALDEVALRKADGFRAVAHHPVEIRSGDLCIPGSADLVLFGPEGPVLVSDLKVVGEETWKRVKNQPRGEHRAQTNLYAWALASPRWSVCYVRAGTGEILEHFGDTDEFDAKRDLGAFEEAAYWVRKGVPPPRPYSDSDGRLARDGFPCRLCSHRSICWEGESNVAQPASA